MRKSYWLVFGLALLFVVSTAFASVPFQAPKEHRQKHVSIAGTSATNLDEEIVVWEEDWESGLGDWTYMDGLGTTDTFWSTSDDSVANGGDYYWHCYDATLTGEPLYRNDWFQWLKTPNLATNLTTNPELSFYFRLHCEGDLWDGATVHVVYGADENSLESAVLVPATGQAYSGDVAVFSTFADARGWSGTFNDWSEVTFDMADYVSYNYVYVFIVFASDSYTEEGFGLMVDDIVVNDNGTDVWTENAEDEANTEMTYGVNPAGIGGFDNLFELAENDTFPSPTHALGIDTDELGFLQFYESPTFDLPTLQAGESMYFNIKVCADMFYVSGHTNAQWEWYIWDPEEEVWEYASNIRDITGDNFVFVGPTSGWSDFNTNFAGAPIPDEMSGLTGVKMRLGINVPPTPDPGDEEGFYEYVLWDDVQVVKSTLEHDIATVLYLPYPTTVGVPVPGMVSYSNLGVNDETGVVALWGIGETTTNPVSFDGTASTANPNFDITVGETVDGYISDDGIVEYWTPTGAGLATISANHSLANDQIPDNNTALIDIDVKEVGVYEIGNDTRDFTGFMTANFNLNEGMLNHYELEDFGATFETGTWNITGLTGHFFTHQAAGGMPANGVDLHVYFYGSGADAPGTALYDEIVTLTAETAFHGQVDMNLALDQEALKNLSGDFWVYVEFLTEGTGYVQPFPLITNPGPLQGNIYRYDGTTITDETDSAWHITVDLEAYSGVEVVDNNVPATFALNNAYPNPFNPTTTLSFDVANSSLVSLKVYNLMGQEVATLVNTNMIAGSYQTSFDASALSSGVYFVRMEADGFNAVQKIMLMK